MSKKAKKAHKAKKHGKAAIGKKGLSKVEQAKQKIHEQLESVNRIVNRLEGEVEVLFKKIVKKGERSSRELRKNFEGLLSWLKSGDLITLASEKREDVEREVRRLAEDVIKSMKEVELIPSRVDFSGAFREVRKNFGNLVDHLSDNDFVHRAKLTLGQTKKELLAILSIPTQEEVVKLEKKIVSLEKRLSNLSRKAA